MKKQNVIRHNFLENCGFGIEKMQHSKVCQNCYSLQLGRRKFCEKCNSKLSETTLYDLYKSFHKSCVKCGTVISQRMQYCPHCGTMLNIDSKVKFI